MDGPLVKSFTQQWADKPHQITNVYHFNKDTVLPCHTHTDFGHSCLVVKGSVEVFDTTGKSKIVKAGEFVIFKINVEHGVRGLEDGTITVHVNEPR